MCSAVISLVVSLECHRHCLQDRSGADVRGGFQVGRSSIKSYMFDCNEVARGLVNGLVYHTKTPTWCAISLGES